MERSLTESARAVGEGRISPVELVEDALERAERWQPVINAFSQIHAAQALEEARRVGDSIARGEMVGPLAGVPVAVKDLFDVTGWETSGCCAGYRGNRAKRDARVVQLLREAGAIVIGKTNQHELACGGTNAISSIGPARNPWEASRMTGGSSGGSASAVAARVVPLALGTDTGGSIRIPSAFCGSAGLKPGYGVLSIEGAMTLAPTLDTVGAMGMSIEDLALAHGVLAGDGDRALRESDGPIDGLRIGFLTGYFARRVHPFVERAVEEAAAVMEELGAKVDPVDVGDITDAPEAWSRLVLPEFATAHGHLLRRPETVYPLTRASLEAGMRRTAFEYLKARERANDLRERFLAALGSADVLIAPATLFPAPPIGVERVEVGRGDVVDVHQGGVSWLTRPVSLTRLPTLSLPIGFTHAGLPLGAQLISRDREEGTLLRLGRAFQRATEHHHRTPSVRQARVGDRGGPRAGR